MSKKHKVIYLPIAFDDLDDIFLYITQDNPTAAEEVINKIDDSIAQLKTFPLIGPVPNDFRLRQEGYRMLVVENYTVFYVVEDDIVQIRRILHGSMNYSYLL